MNGKLIALEGLDGSGKTTVWEALQEEFEGQKVTFTREPTRDTWYSDAVYRSINDDEADSMAELFLYTADHAAHLTNVIEPALERGEVVITDRYIDSRMAYQAATIETNFVSLEDAVEFVKSIHKPWSRFPDKTVYLDVSPEVGSRRSGVTNKMERESRLKRVQKAYQIIEATSSRYTSVDSEQSPEHVAEDVIAEVKKLI